MKKLLILLLTLSVAFTLGACCLRHEWIDATYTEPKTCSKCGKTEGEALEPFFYVAQKDGLTITGYAVECDANFIIPEEIDGKTVVAIGKNAFEGRNELFSVTIPESVVEIENYAFKDCKNLEYVYMPSGEIAEFNSTSFYNCTNLEAVDTGNIRYTGFTDNIGVLDGEWTADQDVTLRGVYTNFYRLSETVTNCVGFSVDVAIAKYTGNPFGKWFIYARDLFGNWKIIAEYVMEETMAGEYQSFNFEFSEPITFDAVTIVEEKNVYHSVSSSIYFYDVICHFGIDGK